MPTSRLIIAAVLLIFGFIIGILISTLVLTPAETNPAFAAALAFVDAAARGDDARAEGYLSEELRTYVAENCPQGSVSACVAAYIPPEWGAYQSIVFRRSAPDGGGYHVDLIGTWALERGFSGVCVYANMQQEAGAWKVQRWAGFVWCGDPAWAEFGSNPDTPNRAP
jgi:hypothetical protein